jgi:hypothetical protein
MRRVSLWQLGGLNLSPDDEPFPFYSLDEYAIALLNSEGRKHASSTYKRSL